MQILVHQVTLSQIGPIPIVWAWAPSGAQQQQQQQQHQQQQQQQQEAAPAVKIANNRAARNAPVHYLQQHTKPAGRIETIEYCERSMRNWRRPIIPVSNQQALAAVDQGGPNVAMEGQATPTSQTQDGDRDKDDQEQGALLVEA
ncbi:unnamed protein product [Fusarium venenatum]|uniref:Uncharacterized protein n=1 Tax=Fusarium venenatum TaxID=56646 RepID=A0A2L2SYE7_9HYPO|nr:uncharacterized protein FVRRES_13896 [Fusarium venenatum]CEI42117.1 unnamed protein product [Fusarium venenatum]